MALASKKVQLSELESEIVEVLQGFRLRAAPTDEYRTLLKFLEERYRDLYRENNAGKDPPVLPTRKRCAFIKQFRIRIATQSLLAA